MKNRIIAILILCLFLTGCRIDLPKQATGNSSAGSVPASSVVSTSSSNKSVPTQKAASSQTESAGITLRATVSSATDVPEKLSCALSIVCSDILTHKDRFSQEQLKMVPAGGTLLEESSVPFQDGETVFQVLLRETKRLKIPMEHAVSPAFKTEYVKAIGNIYEQTYGATSGWMFTVNGKQPTVGCSSYKLISGDKIQWTFSCGQ